MNGYPQIDASSGGDRSASSRRILVLLAHPALERSRVNQRLRESAEAVPLVTINDLYEEYADFDVDAAREQDLLRMHDVIVFQHPFFWYSGPSLLKEWMDLVLEFGFAYGRGGSALHGKLFFNAVTTGGSEESYCRQGSNRFSVRELLAPFEQTARLCGMRFLPPFAVHNAHYLTDGEIDVHAADYRPLLVRLADGTPIPPGLLGLDRIDGTLGDSLIVPDPA